MLLVSKEKCWTRLDQTYSKISDLVNPVPYLQPPSAYVREMVIKERQLYWPRGLARHFQPPSQVVGLRDMLTKTGGCLTGETFGISLLALHSLSYRHCRANQVH